MNDGKIIESGGIELAETVEADELDLLTGVSA